MALGVPLHSQRDEFTGEELYTLRSERYFLPAARPRPTTSSRRCRPRSTCSRASSPTPSRCGSRCRTSRSAGRGFAEPPTETAVRVEVLDPDYSPEMPGRLGKLESGDLEAAHGEVPLLVDLARRGARADAQPVRALPGQRAPGTSSATTSTREDERTFRVSRIRGEIRFATRRERDFRASRRLRRRRSTAAGRRGRSATSSARRASRSRGDTAWWVQRTYGDAAELEDGVFVTEYSSLPLLASWVLRQDGRAVAAGAGRASARGRRARCDSSATGTRAAPPSSRPSPTGVDDEIVERPAAPGRAPSASPSSRRCSPTCSTAAATSTEAAIPAAELVERFRIPPEELEEHLSLLNLVNFGGGCYAVYAELRRRRGPRRQGALRRHVPRRRRG